jgi:PAS domain S-box-containing protein
LDRERSAHDRFRLLVEGAHDYAIYMLDTEGRVASWNNGAKRLKGYPAEDVLGQHVAIFCTPDDVARQLPPRALAQAAAEGAHESEGWRVRKGGERFSGRASRSRHCATRAGRCVDS